MFRMSSEIAAQIVIDVIRAIVRIKSIDSEIIGRFRDR